MKMNFCYMALENFLKDIYSFIKSSDIIKNCDSKFCIIENKLTFNLNLENIITIEIESSENKQVYDMLVVKIINKKYGLIDFFNLNFSIEMGVTSNDDIGLNFGIVKTQAKSKYDALLKVPKYEWFLNNKPSSNEIKLIADIIKDYLNVFI